MKKRLLQHALELLEADSFGWGKKAAYKQSSCSYVLAAFGFWVLPDLCAHVDLFNFGDVIPNTLYKYLSYKLSISR